MNAQEQLVKWLKEGDLGLIHIDIAVMEWIRDREDLPEGVKNLLVVPGGGGVIRNLFNQMKSIIGTVELAYRRGKQEGEEKKK